jgi:hypothetical protein
MSHQLLVEPPKYSAAYSPIPLQVLEGQLNTTSPYNYVVSVAWNKIEIIFISPIVWEGAVWTNLELDGNINPFKKGEKILIGDAGDYSGFATVIGIQGQYVIVDVSPIPTFLGVGTPFIWSVINWKLSPGVDGDVKLDLSNTIKDFVSSELIDTPEPYDGSSTRFNWELFTHSELRWKKGITTPINDAGLVSFIVTGEGVNTTPLKVGDSLKLSWDPIEFLYIDNQFSNGKVAFIASSTRFPFLPGQNIFISGQITNSSYNGETSVKELTNGGLVLVTEVDWIGSTPQEGGSIFGQPRPEWNGVARVTKIQTHASGIQVTVDLPYGTALPSGNNISGNVTFADDIVINSLFESTLGDLISFNTKKITSNPSPENWMSPYVFESNSTGSNLATIYKPGVLYRIERASKQWLLSHVADQWATFLVFEWYTSKNILLATTVFPLDGNLGLRDTYFPIGIDQVLLHSITQVTDNPITIEEIDNYKVYTGDPGSPASEPFLFKVEPECHQFDVWHLIWRDSIGSFISFAFGGASLPQIEKESQTYYNNQFYSKFNNGEFKEDMLNSGELEFFSRSRKKIELNSGWVNQSELELIEDLFKSTQVYIQSPSGEIKRAKILDTTIPLNNYTQDLVSFTLQVALSNNEYNY